MLISSDGDATARQEDYLDYVDPEIRTDFNERLEGTGPAYVGINAHPDIDPAVIFDGELRLRDLETQGVVAEVLFPSSLPFGSLGFRGLHFGPTTRRNNRLVDSVLPASQSISVPRRAHASPLRAPVAAIGRKQVA